ncbi:MAG: aldo/keto reductase [Chloroflexi bacterium]|nr:aldo/keto reductase [Chloroflexota bacterium]
MHQLGKTNRQVSRIGLGLAALGRPGYINLNHAEDLDAQYAVEAMQQRTHRILDSAWDAGIRYFDAARSYGRAEEFLGNWLRQQQHDPLDVTIGSKWGYTYTADWQVAAEKHEIKEHSLAVLQRQWGETQTTLADYIDLYQIHSATLQSGVLDNQPVLERLAELKQHGILIGFTVSGPKQATVIEKAASIQFSDGLLFDTVQVTWNLLETSTQAVLQDVNAAGMGVIVKEAVANGRLTPKNTDPGFAEKRALLEAQASRLDTTIDALALAAVLAQPWVDVVLSGAATVDQLQSNLGALDVVWDAEASWALSSLIESPDVYWQTRSALPWN